MHLEDYFEFVEPYRIRIKGHRVGIESILMRYLAGQTAEEIAQQFDTLRPLDIYATITYYLQNQEAVDDYLARIKHLIAGNIARNDANSSPTVPRSRKRRAEAAPVAAVFTPDNEPYLGRESVYRFDQVLVAFIAQQRRISEWTRQASLTPIQRAASEIVPSASSIALSIRELVRQGYLLSALVLTRPLMERVATLSYLAENPSAVILWEQGWPHKTRPSNQVRMSALRGVDQLDDNRVKKVMDRYNGLVHGDPGAALHGAVLLPGGAGYTIGKDLGSPARADEICIETTMWLITLLARCSQLFPWPVGTINPYMPWQDFWRTATHSARNARVGVAHSDRSFVLTGERTAATTWRRTAEGARSHRHARLRRCNVPPLSPHSTPLWSP